MLFNLFLRFRERLVGLAPLITVAPVRPLVVVVGKPGIEVPLELLDRTVELLAESLPEELVQYGAVEPLHEPVCPGASHLGQAVLDVVQGQEELVMVPLEPAIEPVSYTHLT